MSLKHWIPFRLMLYIQSNFQLKTNHENAQTLIQQFFSDGDNEDPVGSRGPQKKIHDRIDLSLVHKVDYEETNHNFTENQSL